MSALGRKRTLSKKGTGVGRKMKVSSIIGLLGIALCGCAAQERATLTQHAQTEMVGMTKKDLLLCAGAPLRQEKVEDIDVLAYSWGGDNVVNCNGDVCNSTHRYCDATVIIKNGLIQNINGVFSNGEQCALIFENCLKHQQ